MRRKLSTVAGGLMVAAAIALVAILLGSPSSAPAQKGQAPAAPAQKGQEAPAAPAQKSQEAPAAPAQKGDEAPAAPAQKDAQAPASATAELPAGYIGSETCQGCHD